MQRQADRLTRALLEWQQSADPLPSAFDRSQYEETKRRLEQIGYGGADEEGR